MGETEHEDDLVSRRRIVGQRTASSNGLERDRLPGRELCTCRDAPSADDGTTLYGCLVPDDPGADDGTKLYGGLVPLAIANLGYAVGARASE